MALLSVSIDTSLTSRNFAVFASSIDGNIGTDTFGADLRFGIVDISFLAFNTIVGFALKAQWILAFYASSGFGVGISSQRADFDAMSVE
jgi:hypothetical protein